MNPIHTTLAAVAALAAAGQIKKRGSRNATTSDAFRRWFGNSQVVDRTNNPLVVYHGTPDMRKIWKKRKKLVRYDFSFFYI